MKIAIPTRDHMVDNHFGHCQYYTIFTIDNHLITAQETLPSPEGCGCKSNIASLMKEMGITLMLAGNMGDGAKNVLGAHNINVIRGCSGNVTDVLRKYLNGEIRDSGEGCNHHECNH